MTTKARSYEYEESKVKVSGEAAAPEQRPEMSHGEEVYFLARGVVREVAFPEDKDGNINRVAKVKLEAGFVVESEGAEQLIAEEREHATGQTNITAEIKRATKGETPQPKPKPKPAAKSKPKVVELHKDEAAKKDEDLFGDNDDEFDEFADDDLL